jgi:exoribonuclease R
MAGPDQNAIARLRQTAQALGVDWAETTPLVTFVPTLDQHDPIHAALMLAIRRAGPGASYATYQEGVVPWHAAMAATYVHATAPLRRLADRYVVRAALEIANGRPVPVAVSQAFERLPATMARADALAGRIGRAAIDLAEASLLAGKEGTVYSAIVTEVDDRWAKIQLRDLPVIGRVAAGGVAPGDPVDVRLASIDTRRRTIAFERS